MLVYFIGWILRVGFCGRYYTRTLLQFYDKVHYLWYAGKKMGSDSYTFAQGAPHFQLLFESVNIVVLCVSFKTFQY